MLTLNQLFPGDTAEVDALTAYAYPPSGRWLRVNMVSSVDGAAVLEGRVGALTGPADQELLVLLRSLSDVLIVGAGTLRAEGYGPVRATRALADVRRDDGQLPHPRLAVLTRSLGVDLESRAFTEAPERPIIVTTEHADPERRRAAEEVADVVVAGDHDVDLTVALERLEGAGMQRMLSEGGPHTLGELYTHDLVDELCLAVSPVVAGGVESRITAGPSLPELKQVRLAAALEQEGFLFLRYLRP